MIRIGIICPSEIAYRRFMPALKKCEGITYVGIAVANEKEWFGTESQENNKTILEKEHDKAQAFVAEYGGELFNSYQELLESNAIDAVYLPLPPGLHYKWAKEVLEHGKHLLCEKPFTTKLENTRELLAIARANNLAVHENYMFKFHSQIEAIKKLLDDKVIGDIRLLRISFGFPFRGAVDFRYNKALGGGALLDCGGYTLKLASEFLGDTAKVTTSQLNYREDFQVDIYGSATLINDSGTTAQVSFGMDNSYKCDLEVWGSKGTITNGRILTAPEGFEPTLVIKKGNEEETVKLPSDDTFKKSIEFFQACVMDENNRLSNYDEIERQSMKVECFMEGN